MAWFTTKNGKHINTDWFTMEQQIKRNKEIADKLNASGKAIRPVSKAQLKRKVVMPAGGGPKKSPEEIAQRFAKNLSKQGISNEWEIQNWLMSKSSGYRNSLAKDIGIEGKGDDRVKALAHKLYITGKGEEATPKTEPPKPKEPEYERTPKMDWIDKRIEGKQTEIDKLLKKKERIEAAKATNWEKNPYYYDESDIISTQKEIDKVKADLEKYKQDMETEIGKAKSRNVPAITNFLNDWHDKTIEFYTNRKAEFDKAVIERNAKNTEYSQWYHGSEAYELKNKDLDAYKSKVRAHKEYRDKFDKEWRDVTQFFEGSGTWENNMRKAVAQEKNRKYDDIIYRTNELIGEITDAGGLYVGKSGDLNGVIVGKNGRVNLETIGAGGYNIQRYHFRTLIHKLADAPKTITNKYGFEVENTDSPVVEFEDSWWQKLKKLKQTSPDSYKDLDMKHAVEDKIDNLLRKYNDDLYRYNSDVANLYDSLDRHGITDDEFWAAYHALADILGIKKS